MTVAGLALALMQALALMPALALAHPVVATGAHSHAITFHDRGPKPHLRSAVVHH